jgi:hypothetical protein
MEYTVDFDDGDAETELGEVAVAAMLEAAGDFGAARLRLLALAAGGLELY